MKIIIETIKDIITILVVTLIILILLMGCLITGGTFNKYFYDIYLKFYDYLEKFIGE